MNESKNKPDEIMKNSENETSEITDEVENEAFQTDEEIIENAEKESLDDESEEQHDEILDSTEHTLDVKSEDVKRGGEFVDDFVLPSKAKKHIKTKLLVEKSKSIVEETNKRIEACKLSLETDLKKYEDVKYALREGEYNACVSLMEKLGCQIKDNEPFEETTKLLEAKEALKPFAIKVPSKGKLAGLIYALITGLIVAVGLIYLATEKLEMTFDLTTLPSENMVQSILAWFSTIIGIREDVYIGSGVLATVVLLVMIFTYVVSVRIKTNCNLNFAVKQFVEAQLYAEEHANCTKEINEVSTHIQALIETLKTYQVLLNEQRGKLQRIFYIEGEKEKSTEYHDKSYIEILETKSLIDAIKDLLDTSISDEEELSSKSVLLLESANEQADKALKRFYE